MKQIVRLLCVAAVLMTGVFADAVDGARAGGEGPVGTGVVDNVITYSLETYSAKDMREAANDVDLLGYGVAFAGLPAWQTVYLIRIARFRPDIAAMIANVLTPAGTGASASSDEVADPGARRWALWRFCSFVEQQRNIAERHGSGVQITNADRAAGLVLLFLEDLGVDCP